MRHHPLTDRYARSSLDVLHSVLRERFTDLQPFLDRVGWEEADLAAWLRDPEDNLLLEAVTFLLTALDVRGASDRGPSLPGIGGTEIDRGYHVSTGVSDPGVRDIEASLESSRSIESETSDTAPAADTETHPGRLLLSLVRSVKLALIDAGALAWEDVLDDHRTMERTYRLSRAP